MDALPIESVIPPLRAALRDAGAAVLQAPPGAGKTTRVPLALLDEPWLAGGKIVMLEPRRLAARAAARRMAQTLGERVGATVGYRVRMDTQAGPRTRIEVVTEGVLTRMLQGDPSLEGVGLVIFDEFHERSLHADLGLALTLQSRALLRDDLRLLVMSATLDGGPVAELLGGAPIVTSEGRSHPVETRYLARPVEGHAEPAVARSVAPRSPRTMATSSSSSPARGRSGEWRGCWRRRTSAAACAWRRCTARCRRRRRMPPSSPPAPASARWCSPPPSRKRASPSRGCAWWWMAAGCASLASRRARG
jgi:HrpA-like RNA helicase